MILAQVHSHPGHAFHSVTDDGGSASIEIGFWSIVLANGGRGDLLKKRGLRAYEHQGNRRWREVTGHELDQRFIVLEDTYDRSQIFSERVGAAGDHNLRLLVSLSPTHARHTNGQMMLLQALTLLPRISERYTTIDLALPMGTDVVLPIDKGQPLDQVAYQLLHRIQPAGNYRVCHTPIGHYDAALCIGEAPSLSCAHIIYSNSDGWVATVGTDPVIATPIGHENVLAAQGAAAIAVSRLYAEVEGIREQTASVVSFDFFNLRQPLSEQDDPHLPDTLDLKDLHIIGGGALTNALTQALRYMPHVRGKITITEPETIDLSNNNRYLLMGYQDGIERLHKLDLLRRAWAAHPEVMISGDPVAFHSGTALKAPVVVVATDRITPRLDAQCQKPAVLLNGGTNGHLYTVSRHAWADIHQNGGRCVGCITGDADEANRRQREGTVSFVSALAGIALATMLIREVIDPDSASPWHISGDAFGVEWPIDSSGLPAHADCPLQFQVHG